MNRANQKVSALAVTLTVYILSVVAAAQKTATPRTLSNDDYAVYAAVLDSFQKVGKALHPLVADQTSTFDCDSSCNGFQMACNGLSGKDESPSERMAIVRRDIPQLAAKTISDFKTQNRTCSLIRDKIPAASKYYIFGQRKGPDLPKGWEHPDYIYFSRVGFNPERNQALINVGLMSGTHGADSKGAYALLKKRNGKWVVGEISAVWALASPER